MKIEILKQQICEYPKKTMRYVIVMMLLLCMPLLSVADIVEWDQNKHFKVEKDECSGLLKVAFMVFYYGEDSDDYVKQACKFSYRVGNGTPVKVGKLKEMDDDCKPLKFIPERGTAYHSDNFKKGSEYANGSYGPALCNSDKHGRETWLHVWLKVQDDWNNQPISIRIYDGIINDDGPDTAINWKKSITFSKPTISKFKATKDNCKHVALSWNYNGFGSCGDANKEVEIYRDDKLIKILKKSEATSYNDTETSAGKEYNYKVRAKYSYSALSNTTNYGEFSTVLKGQRKNTLAPPEKIKADQDFSGTVNINWSQAAPGAKEFKIYRNDSFLEKVSADKTTYRDNTAESGTKYTYEVSTVNECGEGKKSTKATTSMTVAINQAVKCDDAKKTQLKTDFDAKYKTLEPDLSRHNYDWFKLIKDPQITGNTGKQTQFSELRSLLVQHLTCAVQGDVFARELGNKEKTEDIQYISAGSAGTVGFDSDIDVNLKGHGTEYAVALINDYYHKNINADHEPGEMFDINFYAKDFVPELRSDQKQAKTDSTYNFIEEADWVEHNIVNSTLQENDIEFQNMMSLVFMRKNMKSEDYEAYLNTTTTVPQQLKARVASEYKAFEERIKKEENAKTQMAKENRVYEKMLEKAAEKRVAFEKAKKQNSDLDAPYLDWKKAKTYSTLHANEAHCTAGAIVHVVANKQMLNRQFKATKKSLKKLALTKHELYQSFNEQIGFAFHKLDHTESDKDLIKVGKYMHRAYNALKHFYLVSGHMPAYTEKERKAATGWEGLKKGMKRDANGKFTVKLNTDAEKMAQLDKILQTFDDAYKAAGLGTALGGRNNIPTTIKNLKQYLIHLKAQVDDQYFTKIVDITHNTFNEVTIPNLTLLGSATSAASKEKGDRVKYTWDEESGFASFVGLDITTDDLKKRLKSHVINEVSDTNLVRMGNPGVKAVNIVCETFTMQEDLWLPEANITIKADNKIVMGKYDIITKPLPHASTLPKNHNQIPKGKKGKDGNNGGKVNIQTPKIEAEKGSRIVTNGSDGESVALNTDSYGFRYPAVVAKKYTGQSSEGAIQCYSGTGEIREGPGLKEFDLSDKEDAIAFVVKYTRVRERHADGSIRRKKYTGKWYHYAFITLNDDINFRTGNNERDGLRIKGFFEEGKELDVEDVTKRYNNNSAIKPGKPGNGGNVTISNVDGLSQIDIESNGGTTGYYVLDNDTKVRVTKKNVPRKEFKIKKINYTFTNSYIGIYSEVGEHEDGMTITYPKDYHFVEMGYDFDTYSGIKQGIKGTFKKETLKNTVSGDEISAMATLIHQKTFDLSEQYENYQKLNAEGKIALDAENTKVTEQLQALMAKVNSTTDAASEKDYRLRSLMQTDLSILTNNSLYKDANIDRYGNGPGYRPKHSVVTALANAEKNINTEVELFIRADMFARQEIKGAEMQSMIPDMKKKIQKRYDKLMARQNEIPDEIKKLKPKADECAEKTKELNKDLEKIRQRIEDNAKYETRKKQMLMAGVKALNSIVSAIPVGQPALGAVTSLAGDAISAKLAGEDDAVNYAFQNADIEGAMNSISEGYIGKMETRKQKAIDGYENQQKINKDPGLLLKTAFTKIQKQARSEAIGKKLGVNDVAAYEQKMENIKNRINITSKAAVGARDIYNSYSVPQNKLDAMVDKALAQDGSARFLKAKIDTQNELKKEIFSKINNLTNEVVKNYAEINTNIDNLRHLNLLELNPAAYSDQVLKEMRTITDGALDRLALIEYELIKVYEYTVLEEYPHALPSQKVFDILYKNELKRYKKEGKIDVDELIKTLTLGYVNELQNVKNYLKNHAENIRNDKEITFYLNKNTAPEILKQLNEGKTAVLDLQKHLLNEVVAPGYADLRLEDLKMTNIKFDGTFDQNTKATLSAKVGNEGLIRKGENYYYFTTSYDNDLSNENWEWDIVENNEVIGTSELSQGTVALMEYISGQKYDNKSSRLIYTAPPAWTNVILDLEWKRNAAIEVSLRKSITEIQFAIKCSFNKSENTPKKVLDVRLHDSSIGTKCLVEEDAGHPDKIEVVETYLNYYNLVETGNTVTLEIPEQKDVNGYVVQPDKVFDKWVVTDPSLIIGDAKGRKITLKMDKDLVAIAKFKPNPAIAQNSTTSLAGGQ